MLVSFAQLCDAFVSRLQDTGHSNELDLLVGASSSMPFVVFYLHFLGACLCVVLGVRVGGKSVLWSVQFCG